MTEGEFSDMVATMLEDDEAWTNTFAECGVSHIRTFKEAGVLSRNTGLVVHMANGNQFQLTIVRSK